MSDPGRGYGGLSDRQSDDEYDSAGNGNGTAYFGDHVHASGDRQNHGAEERRRGSSSSKKSKKK